MRERLTDLLDAFALLLLAAGIGCEVAGWFAVAVHVPHGLVIATAGLGAFAAGAVVLAGSYLAARSGDR